jgi:Icc-related predicted phosphoesterase
VDGYRIKKLMPTFTAISDTHLKHHSLQLNKTDVIIHAGDVSSRGRESEVLDFLDWFSKLDFEYKIFIAGNHDFFFEQADENRIHNKIPDNVIYLNDSGTNVKGLNIWGSPISPWFYNWAFNRHRGAQIKKHWDLIPNDTDILITHGPPHKILDRTLSGDDAGCEDLYNKIKEIKPKYHIFGHIHEGYGTYKNEDTTFINASVVNANYNLVNKPIVFELNAA